LQIVTALFATTAPVLIGAALIAGDALPLLLGEKWRGLVVPFQFLAPAGAALVIVATLPPLLNALGRPDIPMKVEMMSIVIYPVLLLLAAKTFGLLGVCAIWIIIYPTHVLGLVHATRHATGLTVGRLLRELRPFAMALVVMSGAVVLTQSYAASQTTGMRVMLCVAIGGLAYAGAAMAILGRDRLMAGIAFIKQLKNSWRQPDTGVAV
jgi:O-antigen/teichoic acid export membrane protein